MHKDVKYVLMNEDEIKAAVQMVAGEINKDFGDEPILAVVVLKGSMFFASDLLRELKMPVTLEFMKVSSYGSGSKSSGNIDIKLDIAEDLTGKNVIIIEDIIDSGNTLARLKDVLSKRNANCVKICTLLDKIGRRETEIDADYTGRQVPDEFVIGYGLDFSENYRSLPYIGVLDEKVYM